MARGEEKQRSQRSKISELIGLAFFVAAAIIGLSLLSYSIGDPSANTVKIPGSNPGNFAGRFGSYTADLLLQFGGFASILLPIVLIIVGYFFFSGRQLRLKMNQLFGYLLLLLSLSTILAMILPKTAGAIGGGGEIGEVLAGFLTFTLNQVGGMLVAIAFLLASLIITVDFSFVEVGKQIVKLGAAMGRAVSAWWTMRQVKQKRRERRDQSEVKIDADQPEPVIRFGGGKEKKTKPAAVAAKPPKKVDIGAPVRTTVIEEIPAPPPPVVAEEPAEKVFESIELTEKEQEAMAPVAEEPKKKPPAPPKRIEQEKITIHKEAETEAARQISFTKLAGKYESPPLDIFKESEKSDKVLDREALLAQSVTLASKLKTFGVEGKVREIHPGPVITMFEYEPAPGIKVSRIANLEDDLAMALQAEKVRIIAPIPGKGAVGIEIPSLRRELVFLREILESKEFNDAESPLTVAFGKDRAGHPMVEDLAKMPHLLVAGTTGSGKSVFLNAMIMSLLFKSTPEQVRLLMVDPKQLELNMYSEIPHMLQPVITEPKKAALLLRWAVGEMEDRYRQLAEVGVRNIDSYNKKVRKMQTKAPRHGSITGDDAPTAPQPLPYIVVIIDELADLMMVAAKEVEESIARLAQMARAAGIHVIIATQRPSVDVITGVIKANFPSRIAFQVRSRIDSRTILDETGANNLLGMGDALFLPPGTAKLTRFHAAFISDDEVHESVTYLKDHNPPPEYVDIRTSSGADLHEASLDEVTLDGDDNEAELYDKAIEIVARDRKASVSYIQRRLKIGYNRAARLIEKMEQEGLISPSDGTSRPRDIYIPEREYD